MTYFESGLEVLNILHKNNYEAYFVGGVVRDYLLGQSFNDIDITTNALPNEVKRVFEKSYDTGIKYKTVTIKYNDYSFEITTFRKDTSYTDHRHPNVTITDSLKEDLKRRDFTINAMAMDEKFNIIDLYYGQNDLNLKIIRTVLNPYDRFEEDALRMLRAFYFAAKLDFIIENETLMAINNKANLIKFISCERILEEFNKIINAKYQINAWKYLSKSNLLEYIPNIKNGILYISDNNIIIKDILEFFTICFYLDKADNSFWKLKKASRNKIEKTIDLIEVTKDGNFNNLILYSYGKEICLLANRINLILKYNLDLSEKISNAYDNLVIKKTCDLKFKGQDILELTNISEVSEISDILDFIKFEILNNNLENDYNKILEFLKKNKRLK